MTAATAPLSPEVQAAIAECVRAQVDQALGERTRRVSILVFSGEMDKLLTAFTVATGAAAMDYSVTMFFSFWGLAGIRQKGISEGKTITEKMLTAMLAKQDYAGLPVSRMNMGGLGPRLFEHVMKGKRVAGLGELVEVAREFGVRLVACQMSMDVMGVRREELLPEVEVGGVAAYLADASQAGVTLFI